MSYGQCQSREQRGGENTFCPVSDVSARGVTTGAHGPDLGNFTIFKESLEIQIFM